VKETEIRPKALLDRYIELSAQDAEHCFKDVTCSDLVCVACGSDNTVYQFKKFGFTYSRCSQCGTLFQTPRPSLDSFDQFYCNSKSSKYWADVFFPTVAEVRREKIFQPRVEQLSAICKKNKIEVKRLVDVGAGYGIFLDEWKKRFSAVEAVAIEPSKSLAQECRTKGFHVEETIVEHVTGLDDFADLVVCFEVLEHVHDPLSFVSLLKKIVRPGGYLLVSTLSIDGFDLQILGSESTQISPPHHINFLSVSGFEKLFKRAGLEDVVVTTPGKLDIDIVRNATNANPELLKKNLFIQKILDNKSASNAFQTFLSNNQLSSHVWVMGRRN